MEIIIVFSLSSGPYKLKYLGSIKRTFLFSQNLSSSWYNFNLAFPYALLCRRDSSSHKRAERGNAWKMRKNKLITKNLIIPEHPDTRNKEAKIERGHLAPKFVILLNKIQSLMSVYCTAKAKIRGRYVMHERWEKIS